VEVIFSLQFRLGNKTSNETEVTVDNNLMWEISSVCLLCWGNIAFWQNRWKLRTSGSL